MKVRREKYTPDDVGPSPLDWDTPMLSEVSTLITNGFVGTATPFYSDESGVPYLYGTNVRANKLELKNVRFVTHEFHQEQSKTALQIGDLLMVQSGHIGETAVVTPEADGANCHALIVTRLKKEKVVPEFLCQYINSEIGQARLNGLKVGSSIAHINTKDLKKFVVPLPTVKEQTKIAQILSTWDKAIATTERLLANSPQQKQALMQQLLTGQKRFAGFIDSWPHESFESLVEINYGKSPKDIPKEGKFPIIGTGGVVGNTSIPLHSKPAVVIGRKGTIDKPVLVTTPFWAIDTAFYCCPKPKCDIQWFYYICSNINLKTYNEASGVPSLSRDTLYGISVKTPSIPEQQKIAQILSTADAEIANLQAQLATLKLEKKALMQQLLTGQRRVKLDAEVAA